MKVLPIAVLAALALVGCSISDYPPGGYQEPANYSFEFTYHRDELGDGTFRTMVRDHVPVAFEVIEFYPHYEPLAGEPEYPGWASRQSTTTLNGLVEEYNEAIAAGAWRASLDFDDSTGHPSTLYMDPDERAVDDMYHYEVHWVSEYPFDYVAPPDYTFSYTYGALSPLAGTYRVTVREYVPAAFEVLDPYLEAYVDEGLIDLDSVLSIDDILELYLDASTTADRVSITWDEETGCPVGVWIDRFEDAVDDEEGWTISDIVVD